MPKDCVYCGTKFENSLGLYCSNVCLILENLAGYLKEFAADVLDADFSNGQDKFLEKAGNLITSIYGES